MRWLMEHGGDPKAKDNDNFTPVTIARDHGYMNIVAILEEYIKLDEMHG